MFSLLMSWMRGLWLQTSSLCTDWFILGHWVTHSRAGAEADVVLRREKRPSLLSTTHRCIIEDQTHCHRRGSCMSSSTMLNLLLVFVIVFVSLVGGVCFWRTAVSFWTDSCCRSSNFRRSDHGDMKLAHGVWVQWSNVWSLFRTLHVQYTVTAYTLENN